MKKIFPPQRGAALLLLWTVAVGPFPLTAAEDPSPSGSVPTLRDCYRFALKKSEAVALSAEEIRLAEAQYLVARSGVLPQVGFNLIELFQDEGNTSSDSIRRTQTTEKFYAKQLLFSGFREMAALKGVKAQIAGQTFALDRAKQLLFADVALAFFNVADFDRRLLTLGSMKSAAADRLSELQGREKIGRSRRSEVLSAQTQIATLDARIEEARKLRAAALELLNFLTGQPIRGIADDVADPAPPPPLEDFLAGASSRPDVRAADEERRAAESFLSAARRASWPTLNLQGGYYVRRDGTYEPVDWDAQLTADLPLFTGGSLKGGRRAAGARARTAALAFSRTTRQAESEVRSAHQSLSGSLSQIQKLATALELAEKNYRVQTEEYRLGLVNNLEVLSSLSSLLETRLAYDQALLNAKLDAVRLAVAAGKEPLP